MQKDIDAFLLEIKGERGLSENTLQSYRRDLRVYYRYITEHLHKEQWESVQSVEMEQFLQFLKNEGKSPSTLLRQRSSLRAFHQYLLRNHKMDHDPSFSVKLPKVKRALPKILTDQELRALLSAPNCNEPLGIRNYAMLEVLYATGLQVSELIDLNIEDLNLKMGMLRCLGKGKERVIPLGKLAVQALERYFNEGRPHLLIHPDETACFINTRGQRLTRQGFWKVLNGIVSDAGLTESISPRTLRHSFAAHLLKNGADLQSVQEMLGHASLSTTQVYSLLNKNRLKDVYATYHPRA